MTIYSKRRGRRSLAAILAAMLVASVLAVVAGSPAGAANTSYEVRVDHDNNAKTATVREFAGADRYDTALRVAKNFATSKGGLGAVASAFVASGETLVDSISVAGLAGYVDAPILLTPTGSLHGGVADFIEDYAVGTVYVLGGSAAISDATVTKIEALTSKPKVMRVAGADRYATAAATAAKIDASSSWCGSTAKGAVLINGATDMLAYGVAVQTIAFRLQLPVLMTAADELPDATADFIRDNDIEHVQIIGGTDAVSADVAAALTTLGVDAVARVDGDSAAAVSVMLAKLAGNGCGDSLGLVSNNMVALVRGNPDGVVAAPTLASSLAGGYLVPPLIVGDSLPASVRDYLAATPKSIGADKLNLGIVAVGGTAAVSQATMDAALAAAASSGALTVKIAAGPDNTGTTGVNENDTNGDGVGNADDPVRPNTAAITGSGTDTVGPKFSLWFSDNVAPDLAKLQDIIEVNGVPAVVRNAVANQGATCSQRRIDVTLGQKLNAGDVISVVRHGVHKFGTGKDQRTVEPASATVTAAPADRARPAVTVLGIAGARSGVTNHDADGFTVTFRDAGGFAALTQNQLTSANFTFVKASGDATVESVAHAAVAAGAKSFTVTVSIQGRDPDALAVGDRLVVKPGIVRDRVGNMNAGTSGTAIKAQASPRVSAVLMSDLKHSAPNRWTVPGGNSGLVRGAEGAGAIRITAKGDGDAAGAAGNGWTMVFDRASTHSAAKPLDIDVRVDPKGKRVTVRFDNGPATATLGDLLAALNGHGAFAERFSAGFSDTCQNVAAANSNRGAATIPLNLNPGTADSPVRDVVAAADNLGRTQFAIEVHFNAWVDTVSHDELLADVLLAASRRARTTNNAAGIRALATGSSDDAAGGGLSLASPADVTGPTRLVRYEAETALVANLPMARDLVDVEAGIAAADAIPGPPAFPPITLVDAVATGYAADVRVAGQTADDDARDKVDEDKNGASQQRIRISSSVKAR